MKWFRTTPFSADQETLRQEKWQCQREDGAVFDFDVNVRSGKALDVLALKGLNLAELRGYAEFLQKTAHQLYGSNLPLRKITHCPCCETETGNSNDQALSVFGIKYSRCRKCGHIFVQDQPTNEAHQKLFSESGLHSATYADKDALELRLRQVVAPKLDWCIAQYSNLHKGKSPSAVLDVGAGGGHFLAVAARSGISAEGFELSKSSRDFARENFGLSLNDGDFLNADLAPVDLVTFWGLLEYVCDPAPFLEKARETLCPGGMLVVEVPRADALGTVVQSLPDSVVARHMDPTSHIQAFSDESLMTLLLRSGFKPIAVWYFAMDIYEVLVQAAVRLNNASVLESMAELIPKLQESVDLGRQCDDIIVAAVPIQN
jgi:2-polyprenyl-3-methyl-5-hydroxy-6-metoxy-1,4-benzoquinol methylase